MIDLNHLLLFIALVSPVVLLARTWRPSEAHRGWRIAALAVLIVTIGAWFIARPSAGFVGGGAWLLLLLLPAIGLKQIAELTARHHFRAAHWLARGVGFLHPARGLREQTDVLRALELAQKGRGDEATRLLAKVGSGEGDHARHARAQTFRIRADWEGLIDWFRGLPMAIQRTDFGLLPPYLRALGETGAPDEMVREFAARAHVLLSHPKHAAIFHTCLLPILAFCGRTKALEELLATALPRLASDAKEFWLGTSELAAGDRDAAAARFEDLRRNSRDAVIRANAEQRLARLPTTSAAQLSSSTEQLLRPYEHNRLETGGPFGQTSTRLTPAVLALIAVNVAMFLIEVTHGGSTNPATLHRLGQLEPWSVRYHGEYWRMFTALFLHYGPLHLAFNLYALWVIGPGLERAIGAWRFLFCYVIAGLGSSAGVVLLRVFRMTSAEQLVGASGCVMGIVGVWVGTLLRQHETPLAGRRLRNILLIVLVQTAFDLSTPQISMAAHLCGLTTGVFLGLLITPDRVRG